MKYNITDTTDTTDTTDITKLYNNYTVYLIAEKSVSKSAVKHILAAYTLDYFSISCTRARYS